MTGRHTYDLDVPTDPLPILPTTWSLLLASLADPFAPVCVWPRRSRSARSPVRHGRLRVRRRGHRRPGWPARPGWTPTEAASAGSGVGEGPPAMGWLRVFHQRTIRLRWGTPDRGAP